MFGLYETAFGILTWGNVLMLLIGGLLIYLGIAKKMEPVLLIPIGFGIFAFPKNRGRRRRDQRLFDFLF